MIPWCKYVCRYLYLNADDLEIRLKRDKSIDLSEYGLDGVTEEEFSSYVKDHSLVQKASDSGLAIDLHIDNNRVITNANIPNSYEASLIISFISNKLIEGGKKLSFESVMSHSSKIEILKKAFENGYKNFNPQKEIDNTYFATNKIPQWVQKYFIDKFSAK
jgi:hypothetical protein